jgi:hypothetical protein
MADTDLPILVGMTADARLITARREDVLLVPNAALTADRKAGTYTVNLVRDDQPQTSVRQRSEIAVRRRSLTETDAASVRRGSLTETDAAAVRRRSPTETDAASVRRRSPTETHAVDVRRRSLTETGATAPRIEPVQVTIGFRDDTFTEITSGLAEGDTVLIGALKAPTQQRRGPFGRP